MDRLQHIHHNICLELHGPAYSVSSRPAASRYDRRIAERQQQIEAMRAGRSVAAQRSEDVQHIAFIMIIAICARRSEAVKCSEDSQL